LAELRRRKRGADNPHSFGFEALLGDDDIAEIQTLDDRYGSAERKHDQFRPRRYEMGTDACLS